ncbi:MAG: hypothetical protein HQ519_14740 [Planctomycetes bacterium]|nr:hypothetical protein [Planctomycetota bacterium]
MVRSQDTVASTGTERRSPDSRPIFVLDTELPLLPAGECAEWLLPIWQSAWQSSLPGLVLIHEKQHSRLVDHLQQRVVSFSAIQLDPQQIDSLADVVRAALDGGSTLIAGGIAASHQEWLAAMFVNLLPTSTLLQPDCGRGPILTVMRTTTTETATVILEQLAATGQPLQIYTPAHS